MCSTGSASSSNLPAAQLEQEFACIQLLLLHSKALPGLIDCFGNRADSVGMNSPENMSRPCLLRFVFSLSPAAFFLPSLFVPLEITDGLINPRLLQVDEDLLIRRHSPRTFQNPSKAVFGLNEPLLLIVRLAFFEVVSRTCTSDSPPQSES